MESATILSIFISGLLLGVTGYSVYTAFGPVSKELRDSFEEHERSHSHKTFKELFSNLVEFCDDAKELGYELLWQGEQESENIYKATV